MGGSGWLCCVCDIRVGEEVNRMGMNCECWLMGWGGRYIYTQGQSRRSSEAKMWLQEKIEDDIRQRIGPHRTCDLSHDVSEQSSLNSDDPCNKPAVLRSVFSQKQYNQGR